MSAQFEFAVKKAKFIFLLGLFLFVFKIGCIKNWEIMHLIIL